MADGVPYTPGSGVTIASDDIGGAQYQRIKVVIGTDGTNDGDISAANPMPVTVAAASGTATSAKQDTGNTSLATIAAKDFATQTTLAVVAAKDFSTSALQTSGNASLTTLAAKDFSTETTLAALKALINLAQGAVSTSVAGPMVQALVSDAPESYADNTVRPLSITSEGMLRVAVAPRDINFFPVISDVTDAPSFFSPIW